MIAPNPKLQMLQNQPGLPKKELILEIELNGKMKFESLMDIIHCQFGICHKVLSANVEYMEGRSFGTVQLHISADVEECEQLAFYLTENKLLSTTVEYLCRKYS
ncbi:NIL domain-containing protein [uncultured Chryseobacterium sp.]|jgi:ABC-type metal ion transport system, ATPase component|uniref:NIL domain-containing protein n=1 Tax=uncultured Chryseobacterium sp. TaxID=259322 RepID=UPI0026268BD6|nr:NIL domain-containing protein [uncultured Chryseobacterium sp.]